MSALIQNRRLFALLVTLGLLLIQVILWHRMNTYVIQQDQLVTEELVQGELRSTLKHAMKEAAADTILIRTGVFLQSLKFVNANEVHVSGYLWQHYENGYSDHLKPPEGLMGVILPEQVHAGDDLEPYVAYRHETADGEIIGWYFEATLRQQFDYKKFPFDHKTVWLRMWPRDFAANVALVPDLQSYDQTDTADVFGINEKIVLGEWDRENTFFDYQTFDYDTNFGIADYQGKNGFPELHYNVVLKRKVGNAFIVYLRPWFLVAVLLFAALLTVNRGDETQQRHGFTTIDFIAACSALFFVIMLAHIQLREQFAGSGIVYIEYFYLLMYVVLVVATANTYIFSSRESPALAWLHANDNLIVKLSYWPLLVASMILVSVLIMTGLL